MATVAMGVAGGPGMWREPSGLRAPDAVLSTQPSGQGVRAQQIGLDNPLYRSGDESSNNLQEGRLPGLIQVPRRMRGRRRVWDRSRSWQEKKTDSEFDIVIVPPDGCYMSGSDSDDSDWSVGWFEPHHVDFTDDDAEESFAVLVPSYGLPAPEFSTQSKGRSAGKESKTPAWDALLASMTSQNNSGLSPVGLSGANLLAL